MAMLMRCLACRRQGEGSGGAAHELSSVLRVVLIASLLYYDAYGRAGLLWGGFGGDGAKCAVGEHHG